MPTYEYECTKCSHAFEVFQKITEKPKSKCPKCKGKVRRLISGGSGMIFKGSGFYSTDYKKDSSSKKESQKQTSPESSCPGCPKADPGTCSH